jgi:predicted ATPase/predicted negative regulator of RcsB-dependent stress response
MLLRTLGGLALEGTGFHRPKPLLLLAYLALEGPKLRRYLAEVFFMDAKDPLNSLSRSLSYLRRDVPGSFGADEKRVWTSLDCDAVSLLGLIEAGKAEGCPELYLGPFAEGIDFPLGIELEDWVYGTREFLAGRMREALLELGERAATEGKFQAAARYADEAYLLTAAPELEPDIFGRIYSLLFVGGSARADEVRKEAEDFDIQLSLSMEDARAQFQAPEPTSELPDHNLPVTRTPFLGRDVELAEVERLLSQPDCRLLTLHGPGGVGKSRLALQAAYQQLQSGLFNEGVFFIALDSLTQSEQLPSSIAEALDLNLQEQVDAFTQVRHHLAEKKLLLILDNYEHLIDAAVLASELLDSCLNLKLLVTSRERLNLVEEWVLEVEGLSVPDRESLSSEETRNLGAVQLFLERAKRARLDFSLTPEILPDVLEICRLVEGLPLGLELAAAWIKVLSPAEIVLEIGSGMQATLEYSWQLLTPREQEVLRKLSVFRGGFKHQHAAEVVNATLPTLARLIDKSLLRFGPGNRYDRHPLLYHFTRERLAEHPEEEQETRNRHRALFLLFAERQSEALQKKAHSGALDAITEEMENIRAAWVSAEGKEVLHFIRYLHPYQERRGLWKEALDWANRGLEVAEAAGQTEEVGALLHTVGMLYRRFFMSQTAIDFLQRSLSIEETVGDQTAIARTHIEIGWSRFRQNQWELARERFLVGQNIAEYLEDSLLLAMADHGFGLVALKQQKFEEALTHLERSWELTQRHGKDQTQLARISGDLGWIHSLLGNKTRSISLYKEAEATLERLGNQNDLIINLNDLAVAYFHFKEYAGALETYQKLLNLTEDTEHTHLLSLVYLGIAEVQLATQQSDKARHIAEKAFELTLETNQESIQGICARVIGQAWQAQGEADQARRWLERAIALLEGVEEESELEKAQNAVQALESQVGRDD